MLDEFHSHLPVTDCTETLTRPAGFLAFFLALPDPLSLWISRLILSALVAKSS